jgi:hypothetical protein
MLIQSDTFMNSMKIFITCDLNLVCVFMRKESKTLDENKERENLYFFMYVNNMSDKTKSHTIFQKEQNKKNMYKYLFIVS